MRYTLISLCIVLLWACQGPEARRPVKVKTGTFIKQSVERNKQLLAREEGLIREIIRNDSVNQYFDTGDGSWFYYLRKNEASFYTPEPDDLVTLTYDVVSLANDTIYSREEVGILQYKVDRQELFPGIRSGVKLLKELESATFLFPSAMAYGYHGDDNKIGVNVPVKSTLTILKIEKKQDSIQN